MPTIVELDVTAPTPSADMPVPSSSCPGIKFSQRSKRLSSFHPQSSWDGTAERHYGVPVAHKIVDFTVELDNAIYNSTESDSIDSPELSFTEMPSLDVGDESLPHASLFDKSEFEVFGSSLYTQYTLGHPWVPAETLFTVDNLFPTLDDRVDDRDAAACDSEPTQPPDYTLASQEARPARNVVTALSPTPSLSYSDPSTLSSLSPVSVDDHDVIEVEVAKVEGEDAGSNTPGPSSPTRQNKYAVNRLHAPRATKARGSVTTISLSSNGASCFPCTLPGCKQVCKTLGDLKRHESVLAHKLPSWECHRCHYQFTREDALKRHTKNLPNCAKAKVRPRGRAASTKARRPGVASGIEDV